MYQLKQLLTRRVSIAALTLITGFGLVLLSGFFDYKVKRITLNFMGFTNTGTRTELLFSVSNDPGGFTMEAVNIERKDGSRWVRENNTDVLVTPYAPSAMGRPFSALPPTFIGIPVNTTNTGLRIVIDVQECKRGIDWWIEGFQESVLHVDTGTGLNGARYLLTNEIAIQKPQ